MRSSFLLSMAFFLVFHLLGCEDDAYRNGDTADASDDSNVNRNRETAIGENTAKDTGIDATTRADAGEDSGMDATTHADASKKAAADSEVTDDTDTGEGDDLDGDGVPDEQDAFPKDPNEWADTDGDSIGDNADPDDDNDNALDDDDVDDSDPTVCSDVDRDGCDDCSSGKYGLDTDGPDYDSDGLCDDGDEDDDNDGALDDDDDDDFNNTVCSDTDNDQCDDCSNGAYEPDFDGPDFDLDGLCDDGDEDDDNDGAPDDEDDDDFDNTVCSDTDLDQCEDCSSGVYATDNDGEDFDSDGLCDKGDHDDDNDGSSEQDDENDRDPYVCCDTDSDTCDDCSNGTFDPKNDGTDTDADGQCDEGDADDDWDNIPDTEDNCPLVFNIHQIDQDEDGVGDVCDDAPCPESGCFSNCKAIFEAEASPTDGHYAIDTDGEGGRDPLIVHCSMAPENGGWTLVLNYMHGNNTNPDLVVLHDGFPRYNESHATMFIYNLRVDESGTDYWGHASTEMIDELQPTEVMFRGYTQPLGTRQINFATSDPGCLEYVTTGLGNCRAVESNFTPLAPTPGYLTSYLPGVADSGLSDQGDYALTELPFYLTSQYNWAIRAEGSRWEVDNASTLGPEFSTYHQVLVR